MKFISKLLWCLVMKNIAFFNPHLHKNILRNIYSKYCPKNIEQPKTVFKKMVGLPFKKIENINGLDTQISKSNNF